MHATVVTAAGLNLKPLFETFRGAGITDAWVLGNDAGDRMMFDPQPDLVICVLDPDITARTDPSPGGFTNLDVMIRAGQAAGRGVPTLIIAPPPLDLSSPVTSAVVAECSLDKPETLADYVSAFAARISKAQPIVSTSPQGRIDAASYIGRLARIPVAQFGEGVVALVADLLVPVVFPNMASGGPRFGVVRT